MTPSELVFAYLGGDNFVKTSGAHHIQMTDRGLNFRLPLLNSRIPKNGVNYVRIALRDDDTLTVEFHGLGDTQVSEQIGVRAHELRSTITRRVGIHV